MRGTVIDGTNNIFSVECEDGILRSCSIKGKQLKLDEKYYNPIAPGDVVMVEEDSLDEAKGQIISLEERRSRFSRWNEKGRKPQLIAANIDYIILVTTPDEPPFRPRFIDRALVQAEYENIEPIIVCNKSDLVQSASGGAFASGEASANGEINSQGGSSSASGETNLQDGSSSASEKASANSKINSQDGDLFLKRVEIWKKLGYKVLCVSAKNGDGIAELSDLLAGKFSAFVGQSGVGKSSLINALDQTQDLRTGELSQKWQRGSHTTTKGTLCHITLSDGKRADIIDTPGIRRLMLHDIMAQDLAMYFREFEPLLGKCNFGMSCTHTKEKGCAILAAVESGDISSERYDSWQRISQELRTRHWME